MRVRIAVLVVSLIMLGVSAERRSGTQVQAQSAGWAPMAPLPVAKTAMAAVTGADGRIYVFGGTDNATRDFADAEVYNPTGNSWTSIAPLPIAESYMGATLGADGKIYIIGGFNSLRNQSLDTVFAYDPTTNRYACSENYAGCTSGNLARLPTPRSVLGVTTGYRGQIFAVGGYTSVPVTTVDIYDPGANAWHAGPRLPRSASGAAVVGAPSGAIYSIGGYDGANYFGSVNTLRLVSAPHSSRSFRDLSLPAQTTSTSSACTTVQKEYDAAHAFQNQSQYDSIWNDTQIQNPPPQPAPAPDLRDERSDGEGDEDESEKKKGAEAQTICRHDEEKDYALIHRSTSADHQWSGDLQASNSSHPPYYIYVLGGDAGGTVTNTVDILNPASGTWSRGPSLPRPVEFAGTGQSANGTIYVIGGDAGGAPSSAVYAYAAPPPSRPPAAATPTATLTPTATPQPTSTPVPPTATPTSKPASPKACTKHAKRKHGKCACTKGYKLVKGKCKKVKHSLL